MKYESIKLLFQQDKYVQITSVLMLLVFGYSFYHLSTSLVKSMESEHRKSIYEIHSGNVTVRNDVFSDKSWILNKCNEPAGYCWEPIPSKG
ncbi:MAG TPA: hypothetical protein VIG33_02435 [Pseudobdellovibrionaceae bacterium]|jgi:hypothetical protein